MISNDSMVKAGFVEDLVAEGVRAREQTGEGGTARLDAGADSDSTMGSEEGGVLVVSSSIAEEGRDCSTCAPRLASGSGCPRAGGVGSSKVMAAPLSLEELLRSVMTVELEASLRSC